MTDLWFILVNHKSVIAPKPPYTDALDYFVFVCFV